MTCHLGRGRGRRSQRMPAAFRQLPFGDLAPGATIDAGVHGRVAPARPGGDETGRELVGSVGAVARADDHSDHERHCRKGDHRPRAAHPVGASAHGLSAIETLTGR